jgi:6-pyruvoyltetrahydropterin/6-carboxytetrahydropterin synthase
MNSNVIRVTKSFVFDMAHILHGHDGPCKNIHGHTYTLFVTLKGVPKHEPSHPKDGMLIDFGDLKKIIHSNVISVFDHAFVVNGKATSEKLRNSIIESSSKLIELDLQPTSENLIIEIKNKLIPVFESLNYKLHALKLCETPTSHVEWFETDNE